VQTLLHRLQKNPIADVLSRYPSFRYLFVGQAVSQLGSALHRIALMWLVLELTGSGLKMGSIMMVYVVPWIVFGIAAGTFVDRWDRRRVMIWADILRGVIVLSVPILAVMGYLTYPFLLVVSFVLSTISTFYQPAKTALLPQVIYRRDLMPANSASQAVFQLTNVAGPILGGVLVGFLGSSNVFILDGVSYFFSALMILGVRLRPRTEEESTAEGIHEKAGAVAPEGEERADSVGGTLLTAWQQLVESVGEGWAYVKTEPALLYTMGLSCILNFVFAPMSILMPILARDVLNSGAQGYGIISAGWSAGMLGGAVLIGSLRKLRPTTAINWFLPLQGIFVGVAGLIGSLWGATGAFALAGLFNAMVNVLFFTVFQQMVPDDKLGRVNALMGTVSMGAQPLSFALSGWIADLAPVPMLLAGMAVVFTALSFVTRRIKEFERFDEIHEQLEQQREAAAPQQGETPASMPAEATAGETAAGNDH